MTPEFENVLQSYGRCWVQAGFFDEFYGLFMNSSSKVKAAFRDTDFKQQNILLRVGLTYLILYAQGDASITVKIEELGRLHGRSGKNIPPDLYPLWVNSLLAAVSKYDVHFTDELDRSWRQALRKGIDRMISMY